MNWNVFFALLLLLLKNHMKIFFKVKYVMIQCLIDNLYGSLIVAVCYADAMNEREKRKCFIAIGIFFATCFFLSFFPPHRLLFLIFMTLLNETLNSVNVENMRCLQN